MILAEIEALDAELDAFLLEFHDCCGRSEPREHIRTYVCGQLSDLPRKSVEPVALAAGVSVRTLQGFFERTQWDEQGLRDRIQRIVARDHADLLSIGIVDECGNPKRGHHTAGVHHQWCGRTRQRENCVVSVHLAYLANDFKCLLDSDLYLPQSWVDDPKRRRTAHIPEDVVFRKKADIALDQIKRALANGVRVHWWTFDEWYGRDGEFLDALDGLGQNYMAEVPTNFAGWLDEPRILLRPTPQEMARCFRRRVYPRLAHRWRRPSTVRDLVRHSPVFREQPWHAFHIKDGERGPMVWEAKAALFYRKHQNGLPGRPHTLMVARNVLTPKEVKYFVANASTRPGGVTVEHLLWAGFSRWPVEQCFEQSKTELGLDHFEVRGWRAIHRHLYLTQATYLFCARMQQRYREKNDCEPRVDRRPSADGGLCLRGRARPPQAPTPDAVLQNREHDCLLPAT